MLTAFYLLIGFAALYFGAEWLVRGSASLALRLGLAPLLVGLTVVAWGTSTPELIVSTVAAVKGQGAVAIGNAVGSNILNVGLILGLTAVLSPLRVQSQLVKFDTPVMIGATVFFIVLFRDGRIETLEAVMLFALFAAYTVVNVRMARRQSGHAVPALAEDLARGLPAGAGAKWKDPALIVLGLATLTLGSHFFVKGAVDLARSLGVTEAVIGLTIVAAGTSLPELASSVVAARRNQADIAIGNLIGSNTYNLLANLGVAGVVAGPLEGQGISVVDQGVMLGLSVVLLPFAKSGATVQRWEGAVLLAIYAGYLVYLWPH